MIKYVFRIPGFLSGSSSVLDLGANLASYHQFERGAYDNMRAMESDWHAVGGDLSAAIDFLRREAEELRREIDRVKTETYGPGK